MPARQFDVDRDQWERQTGESSRAYAIFTEFLRVTPDRRKLRTFAEDHGYKLSSIQGMHARWRWGDRIAAYEADIDRQALKAAGDYNRKAASDLASVMTKVPEAARKALELGVETLDRYMGDGAEWTDEDGHTHNRLHAKDAVALLTAANNLTNGLTRYLETAGQLTRSLNVNVTGRVEHALAAPEAAELMRFLAAWQDTGQITPERRQILEASIVEELGDIDEQLALESGDGFDYGESDQAVPVGAEDQSLPMEAES